MRAKTRTRVVRREVLEAQCLVCDRWKEIDPRAVSTFRTCGQTCRVRLLRAGGEVAEARRRYQESQTRYQQSQTSRGSPRRKSKKARTTKT